METPVLNPRDNDGVFQLLPILLVFFSPFADHSEEEYYRPRDICRRPSLPRVPMERRLQGNPHSYEMSDVRPQGNQQSYEMEGVMHISRPMLNQIPCFR